MLASRVSERAQQLLQSGWPGSGALGRASREHRRTRLRRTVLVVLATLLMGTAVARWAQDPSVALPRTAGERGLGMVAPQPGPPAPEAPNDGPSGARADAAADSQQSGEVEDGAPDPTLAAAPAPAAAQDVAQGTLHPLPIPHEKLATTGRPVRYSVEIEDGLTGGAEQFASVVGATLADPRGWQAAEAVRFVPVSPQELANGATVEIRVTLATPTLTARLCAPLNTTLSQVSCWNRGRAVLNLQRWVRGSTTYGDNLTAYRTYLVNHEVGHGLGHQHRHCPAPGQAAPIMVQQTKALEGCTAWPWPTTP